MDIELPIQISHVCTQRLFGGFMMKSDFRGCFLALALLLFGSALAFGQEATILGTVTDPSGAAVPNVGVTITNLNTGGVTHLTTNDVGQYVAPDLQIGRYNVD